MIERESERSEAGLLDHTVPLNINVQEEIELRRSTEKRENEKHSNIHLAYEGD